MSAVGPRERRLVIAAMALALAVRVVFVLVTWDQPLAGDAIEYDIQGAFIADGQWWWSTTPYGIPHPSAWKAPGYPAWVGAWYWLLGSDPDRVLLVQTLLGPLLVALTWLLGRRWVGERAGVVAAFVVALYPFAWQYETRLFAEAIANPLTLAILLLALAGGLPSTRRAAAIGGLFGLLLLVRPSSLYLVPAFLAAWGLVGGVRRGVALTAIACGCAVLVVAPWTVRNYAEFDSFVPISFQDASAIYGTFNDDARADELLPYAWRPRTSRDAELFEPAHPRPDDELRGELIERGLEHVEQHPDAVPRAFFWNGITRFWDLRRPRHVLAEADFQGRSRAVTKVGLALYWLLLPLALLGLWRLRSRRELAIPLVLLLASASVVFTTNALTRYRSTFEPVLVVLACAALPALRRPLR